MKKGDNFYSIDKDITDINHLIRILDTLIKKLEIAYISKDSFGFNSLKKDILQIQRKIHSMLN